MKTDNRVAWTEGMFLRVQHFQQSDRWTDRLVRDRTASLTPYPWGLTEITIDRTALGIGRVVLSSVRGVLPDGTPFSAPEQCDLPDPVALKEGSGACTIYLALAMHRPGAPEFAPAEAVEKIRHRREDYEAEDDNSDTSFTAPISIGRLTLALKTDADELAGFETLPVAQVIEVRSDLAVVLDEDMIPPVMTLATSPRLRGFFTELHGLLRHRAAAIAARAGDPSLRGSAEFGDYLMLQALNRATPLIAHIEAQAAQIHPETGYRALVSLAGELSTYTSPTLLPAEFPDYTHLDPAQTFTPVMEDLRRSLSVVLDQSAVLIPLEKRRHGVLVGMISDAGLKADAGLVLAARSDIASDKLRRLMPNQIKIGSVERISELVNVALPGLAIRPMPVAPRQLPFQSGTTYFEIDTDGDLWRDVTISGTIAIHLASEFPGLEMELWGIRA
ncbi:MAG: type VI secretion system baseplate subunit TssK [Pseudorhodobacter sp.]